MISILAPVRMLLLAIFVLASGSGGLATLTSVRLESAGTSTVLIGLVATSFYVGLTLGSLFVFRVIAQVGHIRAFAVFVSILSAVALVYAVHLASWLWATARMIQGFSMAGVFICIESWLAQRSESASRGMVLGSYMVSLYSGQALSQFLLLAGGPNSFLPFAFASILLSVSVIPIAMTRTSQPVLPDVTAFGYRRLFRASPLGIAGCVGGGLILGAFYGLGPVFARMSGFDTATTAAFMSAAIAGGIILQLPLGRLSDAIDRRKVILGSFIVVAAVSLGFASSQEPSLPLLLSGGVLFGGTAFALYPLCVAHTNDHLDDHERTGATGGLVLAYSLGAAAGPLLAAAALGAAGAGGLFLFTAGCAATLFVFALWRMVVRPPVPGEDQRAFLALPRTTPTSAPLDPLAGR